MLKIRRFYFLFGLGLLGLAGRWTQATPSPTSSVERHSEPFRLGIDVLIEQDFAPLKGKQVGLITNQTGVDSKGRSTADILAEAPGVKLVALFSPEHGIRGKLMGGQLIGDTIDSRTRVPVYSLYGAVKKPTPEMLNALDVLVFDMQDVGARFYTYLTTMGLCMEAAAQRKITFVVLDRPNPIGGEIVEGQVLDPSIRHFTAYYSIPVRHGLTAGELAQWYNQTATLNAKVQVVAMKGWKRRYLWDETGLNFIAPSPNIRTPTAALLYAGIGMFEATNVAVGRGTDAPFERIGAPWMNGKALATRLSQAKLPGVMFQQTTFTPTQDIYQGLTCQGVRIQVTDPIAIRPVSIFFTISSFLRELSPQDYKLRWEEVARVTGSSDFEKLYKANENVSEMIQQAHKSAEQFFRDRTPYLLY